MGVFRNVLVEHPGLASFVRPMVFSVSPGAGVFESGSADSVFGLAGTHSYLPCNQLFADILAHRAVVYGLQEALKYCRDNNLDCEELQDLYQLEHSALADAQREYEKHCTVLDHVLGFP